MGDQRQIAFAVEQKPCQSLILQHIPTALSDDELGFGIALFYQRIVGCQNRVVILVERIELYSGKEFFLSLADNFQLPGTVAEVS